LGEEMTLSAGVRAALEWAVSEVGEARKVSVRSSKPAARTAEGREGAMSDARRRCHLKEF